MLLGVGAKDLSVDRSVHYQRCDEAARCQASQERGGLPVAVRNIVDEALTAGSTSPRASHVGFDPSLVEEDELVGIQRWESLEPRGALIDDIRTLLLRRLEYFF